jgi:DNA-binding CsgD family transcriptional regulator
MGHRKYKDEEKTGLTSRQQELLVYILMNKKNPEIAEILNIQIGTLRAMMQTLFRWYKVNSKEQLLGEFLCADKVQKEVDIMLSDTGNVLGG